MERIRIAIVGLGKIAREQHVPAILGNPAFELVATASATHALEGVANYASVAEMLDACPGLDAVAVCSPPQAHYASARPALERVKHVLMEKPPCATTAEFDELIAIARQTGATLFQTWHAREAAGVEPAARWLGTRCVEAGHVVWKEDVREWHPGQRWIWQKDGFGVLDAGINAISILVSIVPSPLAVESAKLYMPFNREAPVGAAIMLRTAAGAPIAAEFDFRHQGPQECRIELATDGGPLRLGGYGTLLALDNIPVALGAPEQEYPALYRRFADLIAQGRSETDTRPLELVADIFRRGERIEVEPFED